MRRGDEQERERRRGCLLSGAWYPFGNSLGRYEWDGCAVMPDGADETSSTQQNIQPWHGRRVGCAEGFAVERTEAMEASFTLFNLS